MNKTAIARTILLTLSLFCNLLSFSMDYNNPTKPNPNENILMGISSGIAKGVYEARWNKKPLNAAFFLACSAALRTGLTYPTKSIAKEEKANRESHTFDYPFQESLLNFFLPDRLLRMVGWGASMYCAMEKPLPTDTPLKSAAFISMAPIGIELGASIIATRYNPLTGESAAKKKSLSQWYTFCSKLIELGTPLRAQPKPLAYTIGGQVAGALAINHHLHTKTIAEDKESIYKHGASLKTAFCNLFTKPRFIRMLLWSAYVAAMEAASGQSALSLERRFVTDVTCGILPEIASSILSQVAHSPTQPPLIKHVAQQIENNNYIGTASHVALPYIPGLLAKI